MFLFFRICLLFMIIPQFPVILCLNVDVETSGPQVFIKHDLPQK